MFCNMLIHNYFKNFNLLFSIENCYIKFVYNTEIAIARINNLLNYREPEQIYFVTDTDKLHFYKLEYKLKIDMSYFNLDEKLKKDGFNIFIDYKLKEILNNKSLIETDKLSLDVFKVLANLKNVVDFSNNFFELIKKYAFNEKLTMEQKENINRLIDKYPEKFI
jgi:Fe-S cluster assembly iron-binding protein IscA